MDQYGRAKSLDLRQEKIWGHAPFLKWGSLFSVIQGTMTNFKTFLKLPMTLLLLYKLSVYLTCIKLIYTYSLYEQFFFCSKWFNCQFCREGLVYIVKHIQWDIYMISYSSCEIKFYLTIVIQFEENNTQCIPDLTILKRKKVTTKALRS